VTWIGPALDADQRDLVAMLDALAGDRDVVLEDDPAVVAPLVTELAELGIWTLGTTESAGGGGADAAMTAVALERLGRSWPALAWAAAQAHAAVDLLAGEERASDLVTGLHDGSERVAVVDATSDHVRLAWDGDALRGDVDRVDAAGENPHLLVLVGATTALLVPPSGSAGAPVRRTGLAGACTRALRVDASGSDVVRLEGVPTDPARVRLALGAAAAAAGIAGAAADAAMSYAAGRRQFGGPLTEIATVRQSLLDQHTRAVTATTLAVAGAGDPVGAHAVATAACEAAVDVCAAALQSHGGYGYLVEYPAERHLRDAVSLRAAADLQGGTRASAADHSGIARVTDKLEVADR
jgi:hypothetical protein